MAVLNLSLGPELVLRTHQGSHGGPKTTFSPHQLQQQLGSRVPCTYGMLDLEEVSAVLAEHSNLYLFVPLSFPEEFRWGRAASPNTCTKQGTKMGCLRSACLSARHLTQSLITVAVNYIFPFHLVGVFPAAAWNRCFPSPHWTQPCREVCCISRNAVHTRIGKGTCPPLPLSTGLNATLLQGRTGIWGRIRGWKEGRKEGIPRGLGTGSGRSEAAGGAAQKLLSFLKSPSRHHCSSPRSPQTLFLPFAGVHVPVVRCPGCPLSPSRCPQQQDVPSGHPRPSGAGPAAAAPTGGRLCRRHSDCRALPEGEGPNFALVFS